MNLTENVHIYVFIVIGLLVFSYLLNWYIRSGIDSEINSLKKKIRKIQATLNSLNTVELETGNQRLPQASSPQMLKFSKPQQDETDNIYNETEHETIDADSYYDPTKK